MATATYPGAAGNTALTEAATFVPEIWSDEIIAAYQKNLKMAPLVKRLAMTGKKGDVIHIPKPTRGDANAKAADTAVTIIANTESELQVTINRHFEYSRLIEDIVEVQALSSLRQFYTEDAGYALAVKVDTDLINAGTGFGDGTRTASPTDASSWVNSNAYYVNSTSGLATFAADTVATGDNFTDLALREAIKLMDDADVPMDSRVLVIPPAAQNSGGSIDVRGCLFFHKDALVMAEQMAVRSQTQYKQEYLSTLYTADTLYGVETYRPEAGFIIAIADE